MNPQTIYWEIHKEAFNFMWDRLSSYYRKLIARDSQHRVSVQFAESLNRETEIRFGEWQRLQESFWPTSSADYLK